MIRGLRAATLNEVINPDTADEDVRYVKALDTGSTPGSYLVPTIQANEIIAYLTIGGVARASGVRIWDFAGIQKQNVPAALGSPTWQWVGENTAVTLSDPNIGQLSFDLKERSALVAVPNNLLRVSVPAFDALLAELIGLGAAEHEDAAFFASSTVSGGPEALMSNSDISSLLVGGSANGGDLAYTDILATLAKSFSVKAKGQFVWLMSGRSWFQRILGLVDANSRPIAIPTLTQGLQGPNFQGAAVASVGNLMGHPVFLSPEIAEDETNGSGSAQSHIILTNPTYAHIAQDTGIEVAISRERYFEKNQTAIRATQHEDFAYGPAAGIVVLKGVN